MAPPGPVEALRCSTSPSPPPRCSSAEARAKGLSIDKEKVTDPKATIGVEQLINGRYLLLQKGKKDDCLVKVVG